MTKNIDKIPWIEKYRPRRLQEFTQDKNLLDLLQNSVTTGNIPHLLFYGPSGTGKTSAILAIGREIFKNEFYNRVIEFNASDDRGINAVREKITREAKKFVTEMINQDGTKIPPYKIIILDEADSMTDEAQDALRVIIEEYSKVTRFCFICNYISKVTDAIKSRCSAVYFQRLSHTCMVNKLKEICMKESMNLSDKIFDVIIEVSNQDMRKAIMLLQNLKYLYNLKKNISKPFEEMNNDELEFISKMNAYVSASSELTEADIYDIAASIDMRKAHKLISKTLRCSTIKEINQLSKNIIALGYPIDNVLSQLNRAILETDKLLDEQKAQIIVYSGKILFRIKECSNEYIQLLDYLVYVNKIYRQST